MGSAAPSQRRSRLRLLLVAAVLFAMFGAGSAIMFGDFLAGGGRESDDTPRGDPSGVAPGESAASPLRTITVALEAGWRVPRVATDHHEHDAEGSEGPLEPGRSTTGATVAVDTDSVALVIEGTPGLRLAYRVLPSDDGWQTVVAEVDEAPDAAPGGEGVDRPTTATGPIWLDADSETIEVVVVAGTSDSLELTFIPLSSVDGDPTAEPAGPSAVVVADGAPPIVPLESWASPGWNGGASGCGAGPSVADRVQAVVVHHTVTTNRYGREDVDDLLRAIHRGHTVVNGWCDIGYNFVVDRFGTIWEARTGSIEQAIIGGHTKGFNTSTVGVALLGQHQVGAQPASEAPSNEAAKALADLAAWKLRQHHVDPLGRTWLQNRSSSPPHRLAPGTWHNVPTVLAHRDLGVTSCPGTHGLSLTRSLPERVAPAVTQQPPFELSNWRRHDHGPGFVIADHRGGLRPAGSTGPPNPPPAAPGGAAGSGSAIIAVGGTPAAGYLLKADGALVAYGSAPGVAARPPASSPVDLVVNGNGRSGWVLETSGRLVGFGGERNLVPAGAGLRNTPAVAAALSGNGSGQILDAAGVLHPVGGAPAARINPPAGATMVDVDVTAGSGGSRGWVLDSAGRVHGFGSATSAEVSGAAERGGVRAVAAADAGPGGWVLDADGQLWPFGGARYVLPATTDAATRSAVDLDYGGEAYHNEFLAGDDGRYLSAVYRLFAGRPANPRQLSAAATLIEQRGDRLTLTKQLAVSDHWTGDTIDRLYRNVLGRPADPSGRSYWVGEVANGLKVADLGTYFYGSTEYARSRGSGRGYVTALYQAILGRQPDSGGLNYWVAELDSGRATTVDVAAGFYASVESRRERVTELHQRILGRAPSATERERWAARLPDIDDVGLAAQLAASSEYRRSAVNGE